MKVKHALLSSAAICLLPLVFAGCNKPPTQAETVTSPAEAPLSKAASNPLPVVTLSGARVREDAAGPAVQVEITADGPFASNVIRKSDPERIIVIVHNAKIGGVAEKIEVNDGTISRIETAQLDSGKGPAARITIGLLGKPQYQAVPGNSALKIAIAK